MPKQWERELQKVSALRAPTSTRIRIETGPRGDGMPPSTGRGQRVLAGAVALAVFAGALVLAVNAFSGGPIAPPASGGKAVTFTFSVLVPTPEANGYPQATMQAGSRTIPANAGPYTWNGLRALPSDTEIAKLSDWVDVPAGAPIVIAGSADNVKGWVDSCCDASYPPPHLSELDLAQGAYLPQRGATDGESIYVIEFVASWPEGSGTFLFPIRVQSEVLDPGVPVSTDDTALIDISRDPLRVTMTWQGQTVEGSIDKRWIPPADPDGMAIKAPPFITFSHPLVLPPDTPTQVRGSVDGWTLFPQLGSDVTYLPEIAGPAVVTLRTGWPDLKFDVSFGIIVAEPGSTVTVPDVVGLGEADAVSLLSHAGYETSIKYAPIPGVSAGIVATTSPGPGTAAPSDYRVVLRVSGTDVSLDGYLTPLSCSDEDKMPFAGTQLDAFADPEGIIRSFVDGVRSTDKVAQTRFDQGVQPMGLWEIERAGDVIAIVHLPSLEGVACRGSGIGGV